MHGVQIPALVRELRSHMPPDQKNQNIKQKWLGNKFNEDLKLGGWWGKPSLYWPITVSHVLHVGQVIDAAGSSERWNDLHRVTQHCTPSLGKQAEDTCPGASRPLSLPCDTMDCSPPGSSVHGILQARILEWVAFLFSRGSCQPRDGTQVFHMAGGFFTNWSSNEESKTTPYYYSIITG